MSSSDEEDDDVPADYVVFGTPIDDGEEEEDEKFAIPKKPAFLEQRVLNERGRALRFHGAFTGGFSAGFYNTVGSKEGFTPANFKSSRSDKNASKRPLPEDFMDEEDFGEHGIAPRRVKTAFRFDDTEARRRAQQSLFASVIPDDNNVLKDVLVPAKMTIGMKLLRRFGWRRSIDSDGVVGKENVSQKSHGKAGKTDTSTTTPIDFQARTNTMGIGYQGLNPKKTGVLSKLSNAKEVMGFNPDGRAIRMGIRGQAFGVGALEKEDDDIYASEDMSNYDWFIGPPSEEAQNRSKEDNFGWTGPSNRNQDKSKGKAPADYEGKLLDGFIVRTNWLAHQRNYLPPKLPEHYVPRFQPHVTNPALPVPPPPPAAAASRRQMDAATRKAMLAEPPDPTASVFDLISASDRNRLQSIVYKHSQAKSSSATAAEKDAEKAAAPSTSGVIISNSLCPDVAAADVSLSTKSRWDQQANQAAEIPKTSQESAAPSHFADVAKQKRYEAYVLRRKKESLSKVATTAAAPAVEPVCKTLTDWEQRREQEEFEAVYSQASSGGASSSSITGHSPMGFLSTRLAERLASRFVKSSVPSMHAEDSKVFPDILTGGIITLDECLRREKLNEPVLKNLDKTEQEQASELGMYGVVTRTVQPWHPDRILCRRFNVPDPYPDSQIVGLPQPKHDKYSVFDFLEREQASADKELEYKKSELLNKNASKLSVDEKRKNLFSVLYQDDATASAVVAAGVPAEVKVESTDKDAPAIELFVIDRKGDSSTNNVTEVQPGEFSSAVKLSIGAEKEEPSSAEAVVDRPPLDLFKSIFASDEEDEEESDNDDEEEEDAAASVSNEMDTSTKLLEPSTESIPDPADLYGPALPTVQMASAEPRSPTEKQFISIDDYQAHFHVEKKKKKKDKDKSKEKEKKSKKSKKAKSKKKKDKQHKH